MYNLAKVNRTGTHKTAPICNQSLGISGIAFCIIKLLKKNYGDFV